MTDKWLKIIELYKKAEKTLWGNSPNLPFRVDHEKHSSDIEVFLILNTDRIT